MGNKGCYVIKYGLTNQGLLCDKIRFNKSSIKPLNPLFEG